MPFSVECPCGRVIPTTSPALPPGTVCPRCGKDPMTVRPRRRKSNPLVSVAAAAGITAVVTTGLLFLFVTRVGPRLRPTATVAEAAPQAATAVEPITRPPAPQPQEVVPEAKPAQPAPPDVPAPHNPAPPPPPGQLDPELPPRPAAQKPAPRFAVGTEFEQDVLVSRRSDYTVLGIPTSQAAKFSLVSRLTVTAHRDDGGFVVRQTVASTVLREADPGLKAALAEALKKTEGATFEITVGAAGDLLAFSAPKDPVRVQEGTTPDGGPTLRVWSVLDTDAWRELAGLTFLEPAPAAKAGDTWARPLRHDWGHFGGWSGQTIFTRQQQAKGLDRVDFRHDLTYRPPDGTDENGLPARIVNPQFKALLAGGAVMYDAKLRRVTLIDEVFRVRGGATVVFAGQLAGVEMEETQRFEAVLREPPKREMSGRPLR